MSDCPVRDDGRCKTPDYWCPDWCKKAALKIDRSPQAPASLDVRSNALLNCPFCGAVAGSGWVKYNSTKADAFQVGCSAECDCGFEEETEAEAIKKWNTRVAV